VTFENGFHCNFELSDKNSKLDDNDKNLFLNHKFYGIVHNNTKFFAHFSKTMPLKCSFNFVYFYLAITLDFFKHNYERKKNGFFVQFHPGFQFFTG